VGSGLSLQSVAAGRGNRQKDPALKPEAQAVGNHVI
jgi:hypothetical protein